jgi:hypothetical protein
MKLMNPFFVGVLLLGNQVFAHAGDYSSMKDTPHTTITFEAGSARLSDLDKAALRKVVQEARSRGELDEVTVAAWSDRSLPERGSKLSDAVRNLADRRAKAIADVLKTDFAVSDVDTFNMAENSNWLARTFNTKEAELKSVFGRKGASTPIKNSEYMVIKETGGPSEAVVIAEIEHP